MANWPLFEKWPVYMKALDFIYNYLTNHKQRAKVDKDNV